MFNHIIKELMALCAHHVGRYAGNFIVRLLGLLVGLTVSAGVIAVDLGKINVTSTLGKPLNAEIELLAVSKSEQGSLVARMATPETYSLSGLDYPYGLDFQFLMARNSRGQPYLKLTSPQAVKTPFVSILVELTGSSGKITREYSFLLGPDAAFVDPSAPAPVVISPVVESSVMHTETLDSRSEAVDVPVEKSDAPVVSANAVVPTTKGEVKPERKQRPLKTATVVVRPGESLSKIAERSKPVEVSLERMLVSIYRLNEDQFVNKNMNRVQSGKVLRIPEQEVVAQLTQGEAVQEIHLQDMDWHAYRQALAGTASASHHSDVTHQAVIGKVSRLAEDVPAASSEPVKEVLRLSKGEAVKGEKTISASQEKLNADADDAIAKSKAQSEEQTRAELVANAKKDEQRLLELKSEAAVVPSAVAASSVAINSVAESQKNLLAALADHPVTKKSFWGNIAASIDKFLESPIVAGITAVCLLLVFGLCEILIRRRRRGHKLSADETTQARVEEMGTEDAAHREAAPVLPPESELFNDADLVQEAQLLINFGRLEQAEALLKQALKLYPDNKEAHAKLRKIEMTRRATLISPVTSPLDEMGEAEIKSEEGQDVLPNLDAFMSNMKTTQSASMGNEEEVGSDMPLGGMGNNGLSAVPPVNLSAISLDMRDEVKADASDNSKQWHEIATKLDLAKAYQMAGKLTGAREILDEVVQQGDAAQQLEAKILINQLG